MHLRRLVLAFLALVSLLAASPAFADTGLSGGVFLTSDGSTALGILGSYNLFGVPTLPLKIQLSGVAPLGFGERFAVMAETEYERKNFSLGGGAGVGRMRSQNGSSGAMYDVFGGVRILPLVSLQARYYGSGSSRIGSATFLGLGFGLK